MTSIFNEERQALQLRVINNRVWIYSIAAAGAINLLAPIILDAYLPRSLKTAMLTIATGSFITAGALSQHCQVGEDMMKSLRTADKEHLKRHFAHKAATAEMAQNVQARAELLRRIVHSEQPIYWQWEAAKQCGIENEWKAIALEWGWVPLHILYPPTPQSQGRSHQILSDVPSVVPAPEPERVAIEESPPELDLGLFDQYPSVLVFGAPGSGKSTTTRAIAARRYKAGHQIKVLDPHGDPRAWPYELVGAGMNYKAINAEMAWFHSEVEQRYKRYAKGERSFEPLTFICDEFTNWCTRTKGANEFFQASVSDIRKVNMGVIYISHARTLKGLGNSEGMAALRDSALLEVELGAEVNDRTGEASPTGTGNLKFPGRQFTPVTLPDLRDWLEQTEADIRARQSRNPSQLDRLIEKLEQDFKTEFRPLESGNEQSNDGNSGAIDYSNLPSFLHPICELSLKRGWITARDVKQNCRPLKQHSTEQIRSFFVLIQDNGLGECRQSGKRVQFRVYTGES